MHMSIHVCCQLMRHLKICTQYIQAFPLLSFVQQALGINIDIYATYTLKSQKN